MADAVPSDVCTVNGPVNELEMWHELSRIITELRQLQTRSATLLDEAERILTQLANDKPIADAIDRAIQP